MHKGSGGTDARVSVFFIHIHLGCGAGHRGGAERRTDQFSVRFVEFVVLVMGSAREASAPWGGTRAAGREAQAVRGSEGACAGA